MIGNEKKMEKPRNLFPYLYNNVDEFQFLSLTVCVCIDVNIMSKVGRICTDIVWDNYRMELKQFVAFLGGYLSSRSTKCFLLKSKRCNDWNLVKKKNRKGKKIITKHNFRG